MGGGERTSTNLGSRLQIHNAIFHETGQYLIAVSDSNGQPANYHLTVTQLQSTAIGIGESVEGLSGLMPGDRYILNPKPELSDGAIVEASS